MAYSLAKTLISFVNNENSLYYLTIDSNNFVLTHADSSKKTLNKLNQIISR